MPPARQPAGAAVLQADKTAAIVDATFDELAHEGWRGLSMDRVAQRAGVGKAALYRRWSSKDEMLVDLIVRVGANAVMPPDTGHVRADLVQFVEDVLVALERPLVAAIMPDVLAEMQRSPELGDAIKERFRTPRRVALRTVLARGIERGQLPGDADIDLGLDLLAGLALMQVLGLGEPHGRQDAERIADAILRALKR